MFAILSPQEGKKRANGHGGWGGGPPLHPLAQYHLTGPREPLIHSRAHVTGAGPRFPVDHIPQVTSASPPHSSVTWESLCHLVILSTITEQPRVKNTVTRVTGPPQPLSLPRTLERPIPPRF